MCGRYKIPDIRSKLSAAGVRFLPCKAQSCRGQGRVAHAPTLHTAAGVTPGNKQIKPLEWVSEWRSRRSQQHESSPSVSRCQHPIPFITSMSFTDPWVYRCARLKVIVCVVPMVIHWKKKKKNILQGLAVNASQRLVLRTVPPQRLRAQWQLGIQNKTTNWISHHYHLTLWPSRIPGSEEWQSPLIYEEEDEGMIHWSSPGPPRFQ